MADTPSLLDMYQLPADIPSGAVDPQELEKARYLAMMRLGLGMAGREPLGASASGAIKAYALAQGNARQNMLAQLQAYKTRQEIGAKAKAMQQGEALQGDLKGIYGSAPITAPGGPTPTNATLAGIEQYRRAAARLMQDGRVEDAKRASDIADGMEEVYFAPVDVKTPEGAIRLAQFGRRGGQRVSDLAPAKPLHFGDTGGAIGGFDPFTGQVVSTTPKTASIENQIGFGNLAVSRAREAREAAAQAAEGGPGAKTVFANENTLRDEFNRQSTPFVTVRDAYRRVKSAAEGTSSGAGDIALLFGYMKVLDPGSTVREGEFATAQNSGGIPGWAIAKYNQALNGERLSPDMRSNIVKQTEGLYSKAEDAHKNTEKQYRDLALRNKLNPENVIVNYRIDQAPPAAVDPAQDALVRRAIEEARLRKQRGY